MNGEYRIRSRERALSILLLTVTVIFAARLFQFQIIEHERWAAIAEKQCGMTVNVQQTRGEITDRNGVPLAVTLPLSYAVGYRKTDNIDLDRLADQLSPLLQQPKYALQRKLESPTFVYLSRRADVALKTQIETFGYDCFQFDEEPRRLYPGGALAATVLGFVDVDGQGMEGIEKTMDSFLSGESVSDRVWVDATRQTHTFVSCEQSTDLLGSDVRLTLDVRLQSVVEEKLKEGLSHRTYDRACAVMIDPRNGDVLALATTPAYNPNKPGHSEAIERRCWPVTDVFEPGSVLKIVPITGALESNLVTRRTRFDCEHGRYRVPGAWIHDSKPHDTLTVDEVLIHSSNIGAAKIAERLTPEAFYDKLRAFGFGNRTLFPVAGEQEGVVPVPSRWTGPTQANLAIGHGLSCTAMQLVMAYGAVANGGLLMKPRLVESVGTASGRTVDYPPERIRRVMSSRMARELTEMLVGVVEHGTGKSTRIEGIKIAGKTGTAQKVDQKNHTYFSDRFISSFIGFFPAEAPRYLLLVVVDDPRKEYYGSAVAAPIFKSIVEELILQGKINRRPSQTPSVDLATKQMTEEQMLFSEPPQKNPDLPYTVEPVSIRSELPDFQDPDSVTVPDVTGYPFRTAIRTLERCGLTFDLSGNGIVSEQVPEAGTRVAAGSRCLLTAAVPVNSSAH